VEAEAVVVVVVEEVEVEAEDAEAAGRAVSSIPSLEIPPPLTHSRYGPHAIVYLCQATEQNNKHFGEFLQFLS